MKKIFTLLIAAGFLLPFAKAQTTVNIGAGTTLQPFPFQMWFGFERSAAIYTSAEIGTSGSISKLGWDIQTLTSAANGNVKIYLKHIAAGTLTASTTSTYYPGTTKVFDANVNFVAGGYQELTLSTPFSYNGTDNLLVFVETNYGGGGNEGQNAKQIRSTSVTNTFQYWRRDNQSPDSLATTGTVSNARPNLRVVITPPPVPDLAIQSFLSPSTVACNRTSVNLTYRIINNGGAALALGEKIIYSYQLNGGSVQSDSTVLVSSIATSGTLDVTFNNVNVTNIPQLSFKAWVKTNLDTKANNDSSTLVLANPNCIAVNSQTDFEANNGGWSSDVLWKHATINKSGANNNNGTATFNNPPSGTKGWITDSTNNYPDATSASLFSPFLNFSSSCTPTFEWKMRYIMEENYDAVVLEGSVDNINWTKINTITPGYNNTSGNGPVAPNKFSGDNTAWTTYVADLGAYRNAPLFRLRLRFGSDGSGQRIGVAVDDAKFVLFPTYTGIGFTSPDSFYVNTRNIGSILSTAPAQAGVSFSWVLDGVQISTSKNLDYAFPTTGNFVLRHRAVNACGQTLDSSEKTIEVVNPTSAPLVDFIADKYNVQILETVTMKNMTTNGPISYSWSVSPDTYYDLNIGSDVPSYTFDNGTTDTSVNPQFAFFGSGIYDVCLISANGIGTDTLCKTQYITVGGGSGNSEFTMCNDQRTTQPKGKIYDSGGPNDTYQDNQFCVFTVDFRCYDSLLMKMNAFYVEQCCDALYIFDGDEVTGIPLWDVNAFPDGLRGDLTNALPVIRPATSGIVTLVFGSDISLHYLGFDLSYEMVSPKISSVSAGFTVADTLCATYPVQFNNTSVNGVEYAWDFLGNGTLMSIDESPVFTYSTSGNFRVRLITKGCNNMIDTLYKDIVVNNPGVIFTNFGADFTNVSTNDVVQFSDSSRGCVDSYTWSFIPNTVTYLTGGPFDPNPTVRFNQPGTYSVTLRTFNSSTDDSLQRLNYMTVYNICSPTIANNVSDMGISRLAFAGIDNISAGNEGYSNYASQSAVVEKGMAYPIVIERPTTANLVSRNVWIDFNANGIFSDPGELVISEAASRTKSLSDSITIPMTANTGIVTMRVSTSYSSQPNAACGTRSYGETEDYKLNVINDRTLPLITLLGQDSVRVAHFATYTDAGATATDAVDGNITANIQATSNVNTSLLGIYQVRYNVSDAAGNAAAEVVRTVIVEPLPPTITVIGAVTVNSEVFNVYNDSGATATDGRGTPIAVVVTGNVDITKVGTYTLTYTATDANGLVSTAFRTVHVVDTKVPVLTFIGADTVTVEVFSSYQDLGVLPSDNYCTPNQITITNSGPVDLSTLGTKTYTIYATDCNGNTDSVKRVVRVVDTQAPSIALQGNPIVNMYRSQVYIDAGYTLTDNYDDSSAIRVDVLTDYVTPGTTGLYYIQYKATDLSGNVSLSSVRYIYILDNVGVEELSGTVQVKAYPNPTKGLVSVVVNTPVAAEASVVVTDITGRVITTVTAASATENTIPLDLSGNAGGVYLIQVTTGNTTKNIRIVLAD